MSGRPAGSSARGTAPARAAAGGSGPAHEALSAAVSRRRVRHLQVMDALDRLGSLRQVALELGLTQPATLALVDDLEHAFGTLLVMRERSGTTLTAAGAAVGLLTAAPRAEVARKHWTGRVVRVQAPLPLQAPPCVFVSRRYAQSPPEVAALKACAEAAAQRLASRGAA